MITALLRKDIAYAIDLAHAVRGQVVSGRAEDSRGRDRPALAVVAGHSDDDRVGHAGLRCAGLVWVRVSRRACPLPSSTKTHKALTEVLARDAVRKQLENVGAVPAVVAGGVRQN